LIQHDSQGTFVHVYGYKGGPLIGPKQISGFVH